MSKNNRELSDTEQGIMNRALRASVEVVSEELVPLEDISRIEGALQGPLEHLPKGLKSLCNTARAAHRLQEEVGRLKAELALGKSFHGVKCAELRLALHQLDTTKAENELLRKDAERYRRLCELVAFGECSIGFHKVIDRHGFTEDTFMDDKEAIDAFIDSDAAMKSGG